MYSFSHLFLLLIYFVNVHFHRILSSVYSLLYFYFFSYSYINFITYNMYITLHNSINQSIYHRWCEGNCKYTPWRHQGPPVTYAETPHTAPYTRTYHRTKKCVRTYIQPTTCLRIIHRTYRTLCTCVRTYMYMCC